MKVPFVGVVAEDFEGVDEGELTLAAGTKCVVAMMEDDGWWTVHTKKDVGIFPGSYIDEIEEITLPCYAKVQKAILQGNISVGTIVTVTDISITSWTIKHNNNSTDTTWEYLEITTEKPEEKKPQNAAKPQATAKPATAAERKSVTTSVIDCAPLTVENDVEPIKELSLPSKANNNPGEKRTSFAPTIKATGPSKATKPTASEKIRQSTYVRPVSIFGEFEINSTFDIVFDKEKNNVYSMPDPNRPKYEQEGRWEFRATEDVPPPPPFKGIVKEYQTGQPSYIDFEAKERSAVFDI